MNTGIDSLGLYVPRYALPLDQLAVARAVPVEKIHIGLGGRKMSVTPPWEDTVTLAANAAARALAQAQIPRDQIGLLLVATETAVDHAKPVSIFLHDLLGLPANCRTFELKHACYSGTGGLMMANDWVRSGAARGRKALVVAADIARYDLHSSAEFTQGAGAAAMIVGESPRLLELDPLSGIFARNVYDFWRPLDRREALVDGKFSVDCYLDALDGAVREYRAAHDDTGSLLDPFAAFLYHTPFPKMAYKAHRRLVESEWQRAGGDPAEIDAVFERSYASLVDPSLTAARLVGNTYTASLYFGLACLADHEAKRLEKRDIALFSYGSGCCAEFFRGTFAAGSATQAAHIGLVEMLDGREPITVEQYEAFNSAGARGGTPPGGERALCYFAGVTDEKRRYERIAAAA